MLGREADILFITEVVRNSDTAVLWRGDTLSARELADDTVEESASGLARRVKWMTDEGTATGSALLAVEARPNPASQTKIISFFFLHFPPLL